MFGNKETSGGYFHSRVTWYEKVSSLLINAWNYENDGGIDFHCFHFEWEYSFENNEFIVQYNSVGFIYLVNERVRIYFTLKDVRCYFSS